MAQNYTASDIRARALRATDHENDTFIGTAEAYEIIDVAHRMFWRLMVDAHPGHFAEATADTWTADGLVHSLPAAFGRLIAVEYSPSTNVWVNIPEAHPGEVTAYTDVLATGLNAALAYRMDGEKIHLLPAVTSGSYRARYIASPAKITAGTENVDATDGGDEFCALYLQAYIRRKEEADPRPYELAYERIAAGLKHAASQLVMNTPHKIRDAQPYANRPYSPLWWRKYW